MAASVVPAQAGMTMRDRDDGEMVGMTAGRTEVALRVGAQAPVIDYFCLNQIRQAMP